MMCDRAGSSFPPRPDRRNTVQPHRYPRCPTWRTHDPASGQPELPRPVRLGLRAPAARPPPGDPWWRAGQARSGGSAGLAPPALDKAVRSGMATAAFQCDTTCRGSFGIALRTSAAQRTRQCARGRLGRRPWLSGAGLRLRVLRRECARRQPDVTGERVTILATCKCVAACRRVVLQWPRRAARNVLCIRKEVPAMFANRQTPPRIAL
jgi:hypothetical protein